jgi:hypothetical protein
MDFRLVLEKILTAFREQNIHYALMGGIGLKVQAIANDERRKAGDLADIESLMAVKGNELDWSLVQEYFALFNMKDIFDELRSKYGKDK